MEKFEFFLIASINLLKLFAQITDFHFLGECFFEIPATFVSILLSSKIELNVF